MVFRIIRTTQFTFDENKKPCEHAYAQEKCVYQKSAIRDENGSYIAQVTPVKIKYWCVDVASLEELINMVKEVKVDLIIGINDDNCDDLYLEVYDGYRE